MCICNNIHTQAKTYTLLDPIHTARENNQQYGRSKYQEHAEDDVNVDNALGTHMYIHCFY